MRRIWLAAVAVNGSVLPVSLSAQRTPPLDGAWSHAGTRIIAPDSTRPGPVLSGLAVISGRHFSEVFVIPGVVRGVRPTRLTTSAQKAARFDALVAISGTLEVRDSTVTFTHEHDKDPTMIGVRDARHFRLAGDTLWLTTVTPWQQDSTKRVRIVQTLVRRR